MSEAKSAEGKEVRKPKAHMQNAAQTRRSDRHRGEEPMAIVKRSPESVSRSRSLEKSVSELPDDDCKFAACTPDYVAHFALKKMLARNPHKKSKASSNGAGPAAKRSA
jgi:hypothetical protein